MADRLGCDECGRTDTLIVRTVGGHISRAVRYRHWGDLVPPATAREQAGTLVREAVERAGVAGTWEALVPNVGERLRRDG